MRDPSIERQLIALAGSLSAIMRRGHTPNRCPVCFSSLLSPRYSYQTVVLPATYLDSAKAGELVEIEIDTSAPIEYAYTCSSHYCRSRAHHHPVPRSS